MTYLPITAGKKDRLRMKYLPVPDTGMFRTKILSVKDIDQTLQLIEKTLSHEGELNTA
ncbi:hypothetical protein HKD24_05490 [Gluconobacter sp. LMG 31484]|uniref:Uncharacterized protein n=1 Tax=Gluconobacter vitians TaxID=2728102 RepID=A0ABR9Y414_9PROT|nr:hypothetical protein [Gluconobacter vitians]MBF0858669.1 hypothetical protein [Gluconobacter vitians]